MVTGIPHSRLVTSSTQTVLIMEEQSKSAAAGKSPRIRCAIYTRYSSDLQRATSGEDQIRNCRAAAKDKGWDVRNSLAVLEEGRLTIAFTPLLPLG